MSTDSGSIDAAKQAMRAAMTRVRAELDAETRDSAARSLAERGLAFIAPPPRAVISGYAAIGDELNLWPLLETLAARGHSIALPVTLRKGAPLIFRAWEPGDALKTGAFGVPVPEDAAPELEPEIVLAPLLAFDDEGFRLGYGAGFYDRTLKGLRAGGSITAIGIAFDEQRLEAAPHDAYDEALDWVLTPTGAIKIER